MRQPVMSAAERRRRNDPLAPIGRDHFGEREARHLLWRAGFGGTPAQIEALAAMGPEGAVDSLLDYHDAPYEAPSATTFDRDIMRPRTRAEQLEIRNARATRNEDVLARFRAERQRRQRLDREQSRKMQEWWLKRMIETPRPLEEKMTLFWHGHFATGYRTVENSYHMYMQNQLFRVNALGNFGDLLFAIIRDPAMLAYLDNDESSKREPNENLARELMELFSLGEGNYSEQDIKEGARALTGYSYDDDAFVFRTQNHDTGSKSILGKRGSLDGDGFVRAILERRACSRFMASKLYNFFCRAAPSDVSAQDAGTKRIVRELASELLARRYEVKPALRRLFLSEHFYEADVVGTQIKSPAVLVAGAIRSLGAPVRDMALLNDAMDLMGQALFQPPSVKGWDGGRSWINTSTLYVRQNTLAFMLTGRTPEGGTRGGDFHDPQPLLTALIGDDREPTRVARALSAFMLGGEHDHAIKQLTEIGRRSEGGVSTMVATAMVLLATAMPEYQLC